MKHLFSILRDKRLQRWEKVVDMIKHKKKRKKEEKGICFNKVIDIEDLHSSIMTIPFCMFLLRVKMYYKIMDIVFKGDYAYLLLVLL